MKANVEDIMSFHTSITKGAETVVMMNTRAMSLAA